MKNIAVKIGFCLSIVSISLLIGACGYKPVMSYAKNQITNKVYVNVEINAKNSQYTPILKDSTNEMLINRFNAQIVDKKQLATTIMNVRLKSVIHDAIQTNTKGYVKFYRAKVSIVVSYTNTITNKKQTFTLSNYYDYGVDEQALSSQKARERAVRIAIAKSLNDLFSSIAINDI